MDDDISLPADTLAILNEFLLERSKREAEEENQIANKTGKDAQFEEDWARAPAHTLETYGETLFACSN